MLGAVTVFRIRRSSPGDWLPLCWAAILFAEQLQFWWAISDLSLQRPTLSFAQFVFLALMPLMLFLSAALLLPSRPEDEAEGLRRHFERDGRYGLLSFAVYSALGVVTNALFFQASLSDAWALVAVPLTLMPVAVFVASRRLQVWLTLAYLPLLALDFRLAL